MSPREGETGATAPAGLPAGPWLLGAGLCAVAAAVCLVLGFYEAAFVVGTLGAVAWFLNVRAKLPRTPEPEDDDDDDEGPRR